MLFQNRISPRLLSSVSECFSAVKWSASSASAWASVIGGMVFERGDTFEPVKIRRENANIIFPAWLNSSGRW